MCSVIDAQKNLITRTLNRHRQKNNMNDLPVLPHTKKFEVPEELKDFLIYDSGTEDPDLFLIFSQQTVLELLESTQHLWLADGTFKLCPEIFFQLFTIHTSFNGYKSIAFLPLEEPRLIWLSRKFLAKLNFCHWIKMCWRKLTCWRPISRKPI